ncbi:hypothetical protein D9M73_66450 [compost metagenome]
MLKCAAFLGGRQFELVEVGSGRRFGQRGIVAGQDLDWNVVVVSDDRAAFDEQLQSAPAPAAVEDLVGASRFFRRRDKQVLQHALGFDAGRHGFDLQLLVGGGADVDGRKPQFAEFNGLDHGSNSFWRPAHSGHHPRSPSPLSQGGRGGRCRRQPSPITARRRPRASLHGH